MNLKKTILILFFTGITIELFSFFFSYFNLLPFNTTPELYSKSTYHSFKNEKNLWGAWHKKNINVRHIRECFDVRYFSNEIGAKDEKLSIKKNKKKRLLFIGDSFVEGYGVSNEHTIDSYLEKFTDYEIYNFGTSGAFGPLQYYLLYENLANNYEHDGLIISFLPANDFHENDYDYWLKNNWNFLDKKKKVERYRPYYVKLDNNKFDYFIPKNAIKRDVWKYRSRVNLKDQLKYILSYSLWSFNIYKSFKYFDDYKTKTHYSGYFDSTIEQQEAALFFLEEMLKVNNNKFVLLLIFPTIEDLKRINNSKNNLGTQKWYKELNKLQKNKKYNLHLVNIHDHIKKIDNYKKLQHECDGHLNIEGNKFVAKILRDHINTID